MSWARKLGAGIIQDINARAPWYLSDWRDAWNYRVVPAVALIFFAKYAQSPLHAAARNNKNLTAYFLELRSP